MRIEHGPPAYSYNGCNGCLMAEKDLFGNEIPDAATQAPLTLRDGSEITEIALKNSDEKTQLDAMRAWFHRNFQNPVEETPYNSEEGGYQYLHGGPYDAEEEINSRFEGLVPNEVRAKLIASLEEESYEWEAVADFGDYDDYLIDTIAPPSEHVKAFTASIVNIRKLTTTVIAPEQEQFFRRVLFASVVTVAGGSAFSLSVVSVLNIFLAWRDDSTVDVNGRV